MSRHGWKPGSHIPRENTTKLPRFKLGQFRDAVMALFVLASTPIFSSAQLSSAPATYQVPPVAVSPGVNFSTQPSSFSGSVPEPKIVPGILPLSFADAIQRGLKQNLGVLLAGENTLAARGLRWKELSDLLPNVTTRTTETVQEQSLAAFGFKLPNLPSVIGPFNYLDARAYWTQSLFNLKYIDQERSAAHSLNASEYNYHDARELVVLAVGNGYLQALAGAARVDTAEAQVRTAQALYDKAVDQQKAGIAPAIDSLRARVELQARQQQLIVARNEYAKQKLRCRA